MRPVVIGDLTLLGRRANPSSAGFVSVSKELRRNTSFPKWTPTNFGPFPSHPFLFVFWGTGGGLGERGEGGREKSWGLGMGRRGNELYRHCSSHSSTRTTQTSKKRKTANSPRKVFIFYLSSVHIQTFSSVPLNPCLKTENLDASNPRKNPRSPKQKRKTFNRPPAPLFLLMDEQRMLYIICHHPKKLPEPLFFSQATCWIGEKVGCLGV